MSVRLRETQCHKEPGGSHSPPVDNSPLAANSPVVVVPKGLYPVNPSVHQGSLRPELSAVRQ